MESYRGECHFDGCERRFIGINREEYIEHIREEHGDFKAKMYDELVVTECPVCSSVLTQDASCGSCGWSVEEFAK